MKIFKRQCGILPFVLFFLLLTSGVAFAAEQINLRFPVLYNPNALAGRLYLQPLDVHDDVVVKGWSFTFEVGSAVDYNIYFKEKDGDDELTVNYNVYSFALTKDITVADQNIELGAVLRIHQDKKSTLLADLVKNFHNAFPSDGFGEVPPDGQYYGEVGNNDTRIIADSGDIFLSTLQLSGKYQIWEDGGLGTYRPNLTLKFSTRIPLSGKDFDTLGVAISVGLSKEIFNQIYLLGSGGIIYQDLDQSDFNADNLDVDDIATDLFIGTIWDFGKRENWYAQLGTRWSSERIAYSENSDSAESSFIILFGLNYRSILESGALIDYYFNCSEDLPGLGHGLEPDFGVYSGLAYHF